MLCLFCAVNEVFGLGFHAIHQTQRVFVGRFSLRVLFRVLHCGPLPINAVKAFNVGTNGGQDRVQCRSVVLPFFFGGFTLFCNCLRLPGVIGLTEVSEFYLFDVDLFAVNFDGFWLISIGVVRLAIFLFGIGFALFVLGLAVFGFLGFIGVGFNFVLDYFCFALVFGL